VPAANFWSVTLHEAGNASLLVNGQPVPSLGSRDKPVQNADGGTDIFFGPRAPEGKAQKWLATAPGRAFFAIQTKTPETVEESRGLRSRGDWI